jgi:hypothetical protein
VDRQLIADGRIRRLERPDDIDLTKSPPGARPPLRDPEALIDLIVAAAR